MQTNKKIEELTTVNNKLADSLTTSNMRTVVIAIFAVVVSVMLVFKSL